MTSKRPMKVAIYKRPTQNRAVPMLNAFAEGVKRSGAEVEFRDPLAFTFHEVDEYDCHVVYSTMYNKANKIIDRCNQAGVPVICIDVGWLHRDRYFQVGLGGNNGYADFKNHGSPSDRFNALGLELKETAPSGAFALMCSHKNGDVHVRDRQGNLLAPYDWASQTLEKIQAEYPYNVVFRPHPQEPKTPTLPGCWTSRLTLEDDLQFASVVVTHSSTVTVNALLNGVPVLTTGKNIADPLAMKEFTQLGLNVVGPFDEVQREQFFNNLAYAQWTLEEIRSGVPFQRLMGIKKVSSASVIPKPESTTESNSDKSTPKKGQSDGGQGRSKPQKGH